MRALFLFLAVQGLLLVGWWLFARWRENRSELEVQLQKSRGELRNQGDALTKEREEIATLMSAISDAILAVDPAGKPLFFNSRFALLFMEKELHASKAHLGEIFRREDVLAAFEETLREGKGRELDLPLFVRAESVPHHFSVSVAPLKRKEGTVYGAVGVFHDVTELKRAEKIRIEFVANVSHELRTPLTAIKGYTDTLKEDFAKGELGDAEKFLGIITRNTDRLMRLIEDLLDLSSLESSDATGAVQKSSIDVSDLTEKVLLPLEGRRAEKRQEIETRYEVPTVVADPRRIEQVLVNLVENAIKYTPAGGHILVKWDQNGRGVRLHVRDNGPGIPPEHHPRLFERFYRVDQARSREMGGTGLGLAIVKHIMQLHGGSVWVESDLGKGTEFICEFPSA